MKKEWILHLGLTPEFPRDVGFMQPDARRDFVRLPVHNTQEYVRAIAKHIDSRGSFVNVYSKRQQHASVVAKLFFDIDAETLEEAQRKRKEGHRFFDKLEWDFRETFSANKGFQFFVDFPQEVTVDWYELKEFCKRLNGLSGGIFDESVFGDKNRICRVPFTPNMKGLRHGKGMLWCVPVQRDWDLERVLAAASLKEPAAPLELMFSSNAARDVDSLPKNEVRPFESRSVPQVTTITPISDEQKGFYQDLVHTILALVAPHADDGRKSVLHFLLVPALIQLGYTNQQIHEACKNFIERSKQSYIRGGYSMYVEQSIARNRAGGWKPLPLDKFMLAHPEVFP